MLRWICLLSLLLLQTACDSPADRDRPGASLLHSVSQTQDNGDAGVPAYEPLITTDFLYEPTPVYRFETTAEALSVWRRAASERPTLLLLSNNPHLTPVPEELRKETTLLINNANTENLAAATTDRNPAPLILPGMAIDAALRNGWLEELVWALPLRDPAQEVSLEKFTNQLSQSGLADDGEISSIALTERTFYGSLRNTAFSAAALPRLQGLRQPVIVHIDLSYFLPLYKNEVSTPLLDIVFNTLTILKKMHLQTLAFTFSHGHLDSQIALDVRFLGDVITYLVEDPVRLDQPIPANWQRQRDALYLGNFFKEEKVRELYEAQEQDAPGEAWIKFNLYRSAAGFKEGIKAFNYLAEAVTLDHIYALEYLELSKRAYDLGRPDEAFRMLTLASEAFHDDPFIKLQMTQMAYDIGEKESALHLLSQLRNLQWSEFYYPQMPQHLTELTAYVQDSGSNAPFVADDILESDLAPTPLPTAADAARQRILHSPKGSN